MEEQGEDPEKATGRQTQVVRNHLHMHCHQLSQLMPRQLISFSSSLETIPWTCGGRDKQVSTVNESKCKVHLHLSNIPHVGMPLSGLPHFSARVS